MTEFKVGDTVKRRAGARKTNDSYPDDAYEPCRVTGLQHGSVQVETSGRNPMRHWMYETNLELVTATTPEPRPFQVGDVVIGSVGKERTIERIERRDGNPGARYTSGAWDRLSALTLVTPAPAKPARITRKLGETPTGDNIPITDPRIAWIWADLATYADGKSWCSEYDELAAEVGIPGRVKKWTGGITIAGQRLSYHELEAASQADAERIFREQVVAELQPAVPF